MGKQQSQVVGHRYLFGTHMGAGRGPMDELVAIKVGDRLAWSGSVTGNARITIDKPGLFGGDDKEGGIAGDLDVMMGAPDQAVNAGLANMLGGLVPAFRGVVTFFFDGLMCSGSPYPKPWTFRLRRALMGWDGDAWYPAKAVVELAGPGGEAIKAMNPAHILYECFTNADWGRGLSRPRLDDTAWRAAADALAAEGLGLCLKWSRQDALSAFMQGVLDHIGAVQFVDPNTGLVVLRLLRDDYVVADLPLFDADSGLLGIDDDDSGAQSAAVNEVTVRYRNPVDGKDGTVRVKNPAAIHALGGVASATKDYPGLPTAALALRVAQRDLRAASGFIKRFKVRLDRRGAGVLPGGVFRIRDVGRGIGTMVLRAGRVEYGTLTDGTVTVTALQDVFGLPATSYVGRQESGYVPPDTTARPATTGRLLEIPYRDLAGGSPSTLAGMVATSAYVAAVAAAPSRLALGFELLRRPVGAAQFASGGAGPFCPSAALATAIGPAATAVGLANRLLMEVVPPGTAALIGDEVVRVDAFDPSTGVLTMGRGCSDTVPRAHSVGTPVLFYDGFGALDRTEYVQGLALEAKLLTRTSADVLAAADAPLVTATLVGRHYLPYPPGNVVVCHARYPTAVVGEPFLLEWSHRDRVGQADQLVDTLVGGIWPEDGVTYSADVRVAGSDLVLASVAGLTNNFWAPSIYGAYDVVVRLWSVRGELESLQRHEIALHYDLVQLLATEAGEQLLTEAGEPIHLDLNYAPLVVQALVTEGGQFLLTEGGAQLMTG